MARERTGAQRFDFRGGVNTTYPDELLDATELRLGQNARITTQGGLQKRSGSRRIHSNALGGGAPVIGLTQWDAPAGAEVVAVCAGRLWTQLQGASEFTDRGPIPVRDQLGGAVTLRSRFATHRVGSAIRLYIATGAALSVWDGTTLAQVLGAPAACDLAVYKGRLFASDGTKRLYGSKVSDPMTWSVGGGGIFADVESFDTDPIEALRVVGASLLIFKRESTARFTGVDQFDIQVDTQTEGVSPDVGIVAPATCLALEHAAFGLSERGPVIATEATVNGDIGNKILEEFDTAIKTSWQYAVAAHHHDRKEVWLAFPAAADASINGAFVQNGTVWVYNYRTGGWAGPWRGMAAATLAPYRRADGSKTVLRGGYDGRIREEDVPGSSGTMPPPRAAVACPSRSASSSRRCSSVTPAG